MLWQKVQEHAHLAAAVLVLIASIRIVATYKVLNHTIDEPAHLAAGMEWLQSGAYTYEDQHPPLARVLAATGLYLAGSRWSRNPDMYLEGYHLLGYGHRYTHNLFYSRAAMLPLFWIASAVVYLWTRRIAGAADGVVAVLIFTTIPPILGHAGLATTDMALTAFTSAAALAALCWAEKPGWGRSAFFGVTVGLAVLSKFSALLFLPSALLAIYAVHLAERRPRFWPLLREVTARLIPATISLVAIACTIGAAYRFTYGTSPFFPLPLPCPAFFNGLHAVWEHNKEGHPAWLLGERRQHGFWYYYLVVTAVKTPLALLLLTILTLFLRIRQTAIPLAFTGAILFVASFGGINIGVRHILPIYTGLSVCAGIAAARLLRERKTAGTIAVMFLLAWQVVSGVTIYPDYLAYTNELAGARPDRILADSDLDWGQDMKRLALRLQELRVSEFTFKLFNVGYLAAGNDFPGFVSMPDGNRPRPGWNAVSITPWRITGEPRWAETALPKERIGGSILLYYFPQ